MYPEINQETIVGINENEKKTYNNNTQTRHAFVNYLGKIFSMVTISR